MKQISTKRSGQEGAGFTHRENDDGKVHSWFSWDSGTWTCKEKTRFFELRRIRIQQEVLNKCCGSHLDSPRNCYITFDSERQRRQCEAPGCVPSSCPALDVGVFRTMGCSPNYDGAIGFNRKTEWFWWVDRGPCYRIGIDWFRKENRRVCLT